MTKEQFHNLKVGDTLFEQAACLSVATCTVTHVIKDEFGFYRVFVIDDQGHVDELHNRYEAESYFASKLEAIKHVIAHGEHIRNVTLRGKIENDERLLNLYNERMSLLKQELEQLEQEDANDVT